VTATMGHDALGAIGPARARLVMDLEVMKAHKPTPIDGVRDDNPPFPDLGSKSLTITEIHTNIVINQKFSTSDFVPSQGSRKAAVCGP